MFRANCDAVKTLKKVSDYQGLYKNEIHNLKQKDMLEMICILPKNMLTLLLYFCWPIYFK